MEKIDPSPCRPPKTVVPYSLPSLACTKPASGVAPSPPSKLCKTVTTPAGVSLKTLPRLTPPPATVVPYILPSAARRRLPREGAGGGDLKDRSISHAVKSAIGSQG